MGYLVFPVMLRFLALMYVGYFIDRNLISPMVPESTRVSVTVRKLVIQVTLGIMLQAAVDNSNPGWRTFQIIQNLARVDWIRYAYIRPGSQMSTYTLKTYTTTRNETLILRQDDKEVQYSLDCIVAIDVSSSKGNE